MAPIRMREHALDIYELCTFSNTADVLNSMRFANRSSYSSSYVGERTRDGLGGLSMIIARCRSMPISHHCAITMVYCHVTSSGKPGCGGRVDILRQTREPGCMVA